MRKGTVNPCQGRPHKVSAAGGGPLLWSSASPSSTRGAVGGVIPLVARRRRWVIEQRACIIQKLLVPTKLLPLSLLQAPTFKRRGSRPSEGCWLARQERHLDCPFPSTTQAVRLTHRKNNCACTSHTVRLNCATDLAHWLGCRQTMHACYSILAFHQCLSLSVETLVSSGSL